MRNTSLSIVRRFSDFCAFILVLPLVFGALVSSSANAAPPFRSFTYAAAPALQNPGQGSVACHDVGIPVCPVGHTCPIVSYIGDGKGTGFGKTNIEVCIQHDETTATPNATGGTCWQSAGFAQIAYNIKKHSQSVIVVGLIGQSCEFFGGAEVPSLVQNLTVTTGPLTGSMSISSLVTDASAGLLSITGTQQNPL
jgi:hypothetical protein